MSSNKGMLCFTNKCFDLHIVQDQVAPPLAHVKLFTNFCYQNMRRKQKAFLDFNLIESKIENVSAQE